MVTKGFIFCSETEVFYEPEAAHTSNYNQELIYVFIHKMAMLKTGCQQNIHYTQEHIAEQANCCQNSALNYQIRDMVWLDTQNIYNSQYPVDKLDIKINKPF